MNPRGEANSELYFLYDNLSRYVCRPPASLNADQVRDFTIMFNSTGKLLKCWNAGIRETSEGQGLSHNRRSNILKYLMLIIRLKEDLRQTLEDVQGQYLLQETDTVLTGIGTIMKILRILEDTEQ